MVDQYYKGVKYSPDGLCLLSCVESGGGGTGGLVVQRQRQHGPPPSKRRRVGASDAAHTDAGSSSSSTERKDQPSSAHSDSSDSSDDDSSEDSSDDDDDAPSPALSASDRRGLSMFELPPLRWSQPATPQLAPSYEYDVTPITSASPSSAAAAAAAPYSSPTLRAWPGDSVYDFLWNPNMDSRSPQSSWFLSTARANPVHLWDAYSGAVRASYSAYDHVDELTAALSLAVTPAAAVAAGAPQRIYAGFDKCIRIFEVDRPGRECVTMPTVRKAGAGGGPRARIRLQQQPRCTGQSGLISCMDLSGAHPSLLVAGSYNGSVGLYNLDAPPTAALEHKIFVDSRGVSQVRFSVDGLYLFVGARRSPAISVFDMRNVSAPIALLQRANDTNLRLQFDVDSACGSRFLATGDSDGHVLLFDLGVPPDESGVVAPALRQKVADEAINGVSMHPHFSSYVPLIATCSGQRHFFLSDDATSTDESASDSEAEGVDDNQPQPMQVDGAACSSDSQRPAVSVVAPVVPVPVVEFTSAAAPVKTPSATSLTHTLAIWCVDHTIMHQPTDADSAAAAAASVDQPTAQETHAI